MNKKTIWVAAVAAFALILVPALALDAGDTPPAGTPAGAPAVDAHESPAASSDGFWVRSPDGKLALRAWAWAAGANWYLNRNVRVSADYARTTFSEGASTASGQVADRAPESAVLTRVQTV